MTPKKMLLVIDHHKEVLWLCGGTIKLLVRGTVTSFVDCAHRNRKEAEKCANRPYP